MTIVFDPIQNRFVDDELEEDSGAKILYGLGVPDNELGEPGDFYIDTLEYKIYQKGGVWGDGVGIIGTDGRDGAMGPVGPIGPKGNDGKDGIDGKDGVDGIDGLDGVNGRDGIDGKSVELRNNKGTVEWRREGEDWSSLYVIPISSVSGGGGSRKIGELRDTRITDLTTGQVLKFDGTHWVNAADATADLSGYVPYIGATASVDLGTYGLSSKTLAINSPADPTLASITVGASGQSAGMGFYGTRTTVSGINQINTLILQETFAQTGSLDVQLSLGNAPFFELDAAATCGIAFAQVNQPQFLPKAGATYDIAGGLWISNDVGTVTGSGTVNTLYGILVDGGTASVATSVTTHVGLRVITPLAGTTKIAAWLDDLSAGTSKQLTISTSGALVTSSSVTGNGLVTTNEYVTTSTSANASVVVGSLRTSLAANANSVYLGRYIGGSGGITGTNNLIMGNAVIPNGAALSSWFIQGNNTGGSLLNNSDGGVLLGNGANTFGDVGLLVGIGNDVVAGSESVSVGVSSKAATREVSLGYLAGGARTSSNTGGVFIGPYAGYAETADNKLYISNYLRNLITGDFSGTGTLTLNAASVSISGTIVSGTWNGTAINLSSYASGTLQAAQFPALTGDVTTSAGALATTIAANAVTYAKMQAVSATSKILGSSSTTTPVQEITIGSGLSLSGTTLTSTGLGGTVTSFSSGNLSPLFTTSVATATTTPALSFSLSNAAAGTWFGNNTGGSATPSYNSAGALTKVNDTNVTLTLGGTPTTALLNATSLTLGWTGQLGLTRGGTNASLTASNGGIVYSTASALAILSASAQASRPLISGGAGAPSWSAAYLVAGSGSNESLCLTTNITTMTSSLRNVFIGVGAGNNSISGSRNVGVGITALTALTSGSYNVILGDFAGTGISTGSYNIGIGPNVITTNTSNAVIIGTNANGGSDCTAVGKSAGQNTSGVNNSCFGSGAGNANTTGTDNVFIGLNAGYGTGTGASSYNVCIGSGSMRNLQSGADGNTCLGYGSGYGITTGDYNVCIGYNAGKSYVTTGSNNLYICNADTATPLILGTFPNTLLTFYTATAAIVGASTATTTKLGIGLTSPTYTLDIRGAYTTGNYPEIRLDASTVDGAFISRTLDTLKIAGNINNAGTISNSGRTTAGIQIITAVSDSYITFGTTGTNNAAYSERMRIDKLGNVIVGTAALATGANDGFLYIPTCAGAPSGTPTAYTGRVAVIYDTTNNKICVYNGAWKATAALT